MNYIKSRKKRTRIAVASLISFSTPLTFADQDQNSHQLETISSTAEHTSYYIKESNNSKITTKLLDTPRTINIISKEEIDERGATSLQDVLRTTPGITLGAGEGGTPMGDRPFIRGYEASTDILIDGMRDYARGSHETFNLEAVEVSKGPGSVYSGRGSTGGTINLITKKPKDKTESEITSEYQTSGKGHTKYRFTTDNNIAINDNIAVRLNAMLDQGETARRDNVEVDRWGIAPSITFGLNTPTRLTLGYNYLEFNDTPDMGVPFSNTMNLWGNTPFEGGKFDTNYGRPGVDFRKYESESFNLNLEHDFNDNLSLKAVVKDLTSMQDYFFTRVSFECTNRGGSAINTDNSACSANGTDLYYNRGDRARYRESHSSVGQLDLTGKFNTGNITHNFVVGADYSKERISNKDTTVTGLPSNEKVDLYNPTYGDYSNFKITYGPKTRAGEIEVFGLYLFDNINLTEKFDVNLGLRFDDYKSTDLIDTVSDNMFNYQLGTVYKIAPNGRIYANYATSMNPSGDNLGQAGGADGVASGNRLSDNIDPEETRSIELGTKWEVLNERLALNAAIFETKKTNARTTDIDGTVSVNGKNRVRGFELSAIGQITPKWDISAGYTYLDSKILDNGYVNGAISPENGNKMKYIAKNSANLWTTYQVLDKLRLGGGISYVDDRFANDANEYILPSHVRFDAFASYQFMPEVGLQLNINNITNERIYDASHVGIFSTVAPGRSFALKGTYRF
ncbi:TonB-dependent receptor [Acinetobacter portensis]|uniref:TonB-dependent receptor n=1 Tax=Acinetobacter portensis TaxID=1839785 RepID=UPI001E3B7A7C|nr:TonB-dependent siderophore receptor [Acinetobacter portensis]